MSRISTYRRRIKTTTPTTGLADVGLIMLIGFMCMTSLERDDWGIDMKLPPWHSEDIVGVPPGELPPTIKIDINNIGQLMLDGNLIGRHELRLSCKRMMLLHLANRTDSSKYDYVHTFIRINRDATYKAYIFVLNEIVAARNEIIDDLSLNQFGKKYKRLEFWQKKEIRRGHPIIIDDVKRP